MTSETCLELHGVSVAVAAPELSLGGHVARFLRHSGFGPAGSGFGGPEVVLEVVSSGEATGLEGWAEVARHQHLRVLRSGGELRVEDGFSCAQLDPEAGRIRFVPGPGLEETRLDSSRNLIVLYTVMTALRYRGLFGLHAACASRGRAGVLFAAGSGSGKSTLVLGLLRAGWSLVADDSVVLRQTGVVEALGLRRDLFLKEDRAPAPVEMGHWEEDADRRHRRRRLRAGGAYPGRVVSGCGPRLLVFPSISGFADSSLEPCDRDRALRELLAHSHLTELEPGMAQAHLETLAALVGQCRRVVLRAGRDVKHRPELVAALLEPELAGVDADGTHGTGEA